MASPHHMTLLHISDMQFGRNHIFGRLQLPPPDAHFDSLAERLIQDLDMLRQAHDLKPDLVVASGDLAEWAMPKEFEQVRSLFDMLTEKLALPHDRVVMVPGNHDINRNLCQAYFLTCAGEGSEPTPPFWNKWKPYHEMFEAFYKDSPPQFTLEEPWAWYEMPDLKLVVAGLNSTMAERHDIAAGDAFFDAYGNSEHYGHFGRVGEAQLRWFENKLKPYQEQGWLRLGVVHHNVRRGAVDDDEHLRDAEDLFQILGPQLNLLLHGHTHNSKHDLTPNGTPILSTGSTALAKTARPDEVPNQYQIIRIWPDRIQRWTRRYDPGQKRWTGDTRCSEQGDAWEIEHLVTLVNVAGAFPEADTS